MRPCSSYEGLPSSNSYPFGTHVSYSCGSCGYELNLNSCNRNISAMDAKYEKSMKRGVISFFSVDESRFTQINKIPWLPYLTISNKPSSWRIFKKRTKLLCRNCGNYIGFTRNANNCSSRLSPFKAMVKHNSAKTWDGISGHTSYEIKIRSLRPVSFDGPAFFM
ncbi:Uncharacterized protein - chloroplastic [Striga hermonthica]|uniref:Uncharacterized protein - chloroplastic n=1 Tax=Striga hermonthica TaxID=68872 RepID=A0A9N7RD71_STRHE|nr:Uncharacterized protein - chloroplastic [Striga hermonthica]